MLTLNGEAQDNEENATWLVGKNSLIADVKFGTTASKYEVVVTKTGTIAALTVTSAKGTELGYTKLGVAQTLPVGCKWLYKTAATVTAPALDAVPDATWLAWNGVAEVEAVHDDTIAVIAVTKVGSLTKAAGTQTVVGNTGE